MRTLTFNHIIGSGSMGTVYHTELRVPGGFRRQCAVKVIKSQGPDREHFVSRMRDEARLLGMLQDEQILGVNELVSVDGSDGVIMEYVEGVDLSALLEAHRVPPKALAELGAEIAGTLGRAHAALHPATSEPLKVIHRDIKPANIMITARGGVRLLDFGVARAAFASRESHTQGLVLGTLNYFPPEILAGEEPTTAVDIYGLGISLWECATSKEWGPPKVQQQRFERRVDQRLQEIEDEYGALLPVLRQILQWDPELRPGGGVVERALLHAAESLTGKGLRIWSREVMPSLIEARLHGAKSDVRVGRTFEVKSFTESDSGPAPLTVSAPPTPPVAAPDPSSTWNAGPDAGHPPAPPAQPPLNRSREDLSAKKRAKKKKKGGTSTVLALLFGAAIGLVVLFLLFLLLVVILALLLLAVQ
ncbi:MAG: serine/threonine protein kinase [Kiritimatiellia bacterium]|jgi:serine/threonine protein kinase